MPQPYNLTAIGESNNMVELFQATNAIASNAMGVLFMLALFVILFITFKQFETKKAFAGASFITSLAAIFLRILSLIPDAWMFGSFLISVIALVWLMWSEG